MHKIGFIVYPAFSPMNFAATSVFETANWKLGSAAYEVTLLSEHGGPVATSLGYEIQDVVVQTPHVRHPHRCGRHRNPGSDRGTQRALNSVSCLLLVLQYLPH